MVGLSRYAELQCFSPNRAMLAGWWRKNEVWWWKLKW